MQPPLVSIIIPTYNRVHLIGKTLDSILRQTFIHWECIVVDDGSTDKTAELLTVYCKKDARFQYHHRPNDRPKGANTCRNYGFELCKGEYINWFDSDDLMDNRFLQEKVYILKNESNIDFVVSKCINLHSDGSFSDIDYYGKIMKSDLNSENFILEKALWFTPDFLIKKKAINGIIFNEKLMSGQEYNFFINVLAFNKIQGKFIDLILTKRRLHESSIQKNIHTNEYLALKEKFISIILTYKSVNKVISNKSKRFLISKMLKLIDPLLFKRKKVPYLLNFLVLYNKELGVYKGFSLALWFVLLFLGKKSYSLKKIVNS